MAEPRGPRGPELTALPGARVVGEHLHPALDERFSVLQGELTLMREGRRSALHAGESAHIAPGVWRDRWNETQDDTLVRVEITPGERFMHMIENAVGARARRACQPQGDAEPPQLALTAQEFSDVIVFRKPPRPVQRVVFSALAPIAKRRGYRATYPCLSRTTLAPRSPHPRSV